MFAKHKTLLDRKVIETVGGLDEYVMWKNMKFLEYGIEKIKESIAEHTIVLT